MKNDIVKEKAGEVGMEELKKILVSEFKKINDRLDDIQGDVGQIKKDLEITREHVARIDERLTRVEKISKVFDMEVIEKITT